MFDQQLQLYREQKLLFESFIDTLATSIDARDKITAGHSTRVKLYSILLADALGMNAKDKSLLEKPQFFTISVKSVLEILFYKKTENLLMKSINIFKNTLELLTIS